MALRLSPHLPTETVARARGLRRDATDAERALWSGLRHAFSHVRFRRQVPVGPYFADFASHGAKLIVEVDGGQHAEAAGYDTARTAFLMAEGYSVLRFWNNEVLVNLPGVLETIANHLPSPPVGEGGPQGRMRGARQSRARTSGPHPHPVPPHKGEGGNITSSSPYSPSPSRAVRGPLPLPQGEGFKE
ncbi:endonuclease domain-containing protein [Allosphingosinicella flava]|nr:endonuclease domain-containing protein [Sphingosinicella flava]